MGGPCLPASPNVNEHRASQRRLSTAASRCGEAPTGANPGRAARPIHLLQPPPSRGAYRCPMHVALWILLYAGQAAFWLWVIRLGGASAIQGSWAAWLLHPVARGGGTRTRSGCSRGSRSWRRQAGSSSGSSSLRRGSDLGQRGLRAHPQNHLDSRTGSRGRSAVRPAGGLAPPVVPSSPGVFPTLGLSPEAVDRASHHLPEAADDGRQLRRIARTVELPTLD